MSDHRLDGRVRATRRPDSAALSGRQPTPRSETIHVRSYDHRIAYDLDVEVVGEDGETAFEERYYLLPGGVVSETADLPAGEYEIAVTLDNSDREVRRCRIDDSPETTAVVEVGNGALSLTQGLAGGSEATQFS